MKALNVVSGAKAYDSTVTYSVSGQIDSSKYSIVYLSGQNLPLTVPITNVSYKNGVSTFEASLPFDSKDFANGLTIATLVDCTGKQFSTLDEVAAKAVYGPGIIELN